MVNQYLTTQDKESIDAIMIKNTAILQSKHGNESMLFHNSKEITMPKL